MDARFIESVLLKCTIMGFAFLLFWFVMILAAGNLAYDYHNRLFGISRQHFDLMNYYGMAIFKMVVFIFYLIPYLAIRFSSTSRQSTD